MRGEHELFRSRSRRCTGIIPACAGSTVNAGWTNQGISGSSPHARGAPHQSPATCRVSRDHPRMRGEHHGSRFDEDNNQGIIPACAGSTQICDVTACVVRGSSPHARGARGERFCNGNTGRDHPRMRGEHPRYPLSMTPTAGSSPHARGAHRARQARRSGFRDHPRMRGEHWSNTFRAG